MRLLSCDDRKQRPHLVSRNEKNRQPPHYAARRYGASEISPSSTQCHEERRCAYRCRHTGERSGDKHSPKWSPDSHSATRTRMTANNKLTQQQDSAGAVARAPLDRLIYQRNDRAVPDRDRSATAQTRHQRHLAWFRRHAGDALRRRAGRHSSASVGAVR